jgi:outer membrane protein OmpA-like peptidoglycan-associated protein
MSPTIINQRKLHLLAAAVLLPCLSLLACATTKPLLGTKPPALALTDAKAALLKANKRGAVAHAPLEMEQAKTALSQAEKLWDEYKDDSGYTGSVERDDEIREKALYAKLYAQVAQAISSQKKVEQQIAKVETEQLKYESLKKQYQTEEAQLRVIITKQQKLEALRQAAEMRAQQAAKAKEEAEKYAKLAEAAKKEALKQMELVKQAKEEVQRQKELAEAARREALLAKKEAEAAKQEALLEKQRAEAARLKAQQEAEAAKQQLQELQKKLTQLSAEFAKVKQEKRGLVVTLSDILFDVDKATIRPGAAENLKRLAQILKGYPDRRVLVEGHTDSTGSAEHNQSLSDERAFAVMGYLISQGLDPKKLEARGFGESKPVATNETAEGRQRNRRVEIVILNPDES